MSSIEKSALSVLGATWTKAPFKHEIKLADAFSYVLGALPLNLTSNYPQNPFFRIKSSGAMPPLFIPICLFTMSLLEDASPAIADNPSSGRPEDQ